MKRVSHLDTTKFYKRNITKQYEEKQRMAYEKKPGELGTLWLNEKGNKTYWKGEIDGVGKVICWQNHTPTGKVLLKVMRDVPKDGYEPTPKKQDIPKEHPEPSMSWDDLTAGGKAPF